MTFVLSEEGDAPHPPQDRALDAEEALSFLEEGGARILRLQFCDVFGRTRAVEVPRRRFRAALAGELLADGSAVEGSAGTEETVARLEPDLSTVAVLPWREGNRRIAHLICDIRRTDGSPFDGDPRAVLRRALADLAEDGYEARVAAEVEFFLLERPSGDASAPRPTDSGGYYQLLPADRGELVRRDAVEALETMGYEVGAAHHEGSAGQHEISLAPTDALRAADALVMLRYVVRSIAHARGLEATFMPKPQSGWNGSGLHTHLGLFRDGANAFADEEGPDGLSETMRFFVGGLLRHARAYCAVTNPLVNSYKRLVPGYEAPISISWSLHNRALLVRVPPERGQATRCEHRLADPAANPYLALAVQLAAGLSGIREERHPGDPISKNLTLLTPRERQRLRIETVPSSLREALDEMEQSRLVRSTLGEHLYSRFVEAKRVEWAEYSAHVHDWETRTYWGV